MRQQDRSTEIGARLPFALPRSLRTGFLDQVRELLLLSILLLALPITLVFILVCPSDALIPTGTVRDLLTGFDIGSANTRAVLVATLQRFDTVAVRGNQNDAIRRRRV
ncbi:hypothetical protein [Azospirillum halopraeferens]|uniref:hypothetical protein n=1 Tax=Azospirillum halopraeferens TaxID=34010 RepID=UPI0012EBBEE0|nr:hypothetical protein [Azospirillum halopraeferens]